MTEESFLSLLYPYLFGIKYSEKDLKKISLMKGRLEALEIFPFLSECLQRQLINFKWRHRWLEFLLESHKRDIFLTSIFCHDYPKLLLSLDDFPLVLTYMGSPTWNQRRLISVVGSRRPRVETLRWMSSQLPDVLRATDLSVVSGGARGVDQWAHRLSISCGQPTFSFVPAGLCAIYPESLVPLGERIVETGGALLSAYPLRQEMRKYFFHQRNTLIAAFSRICLVIQASEKSGTLITASRAADLGRDVIAVPFSPWEKAGAGSNRLIKEGATPVLGSQDVLDFLGFAGAKLFNSVKSESEIYNP